MKVESFNKIFPIGAEGTSGPESHMVSTLDATGMIHAFVGPVDFKSVRFHAEAVRQLLAQDGVHGVAVHFANNGHHNTVALVPLDASGSHLLSAVAIENGDRCPPLC